MQGGGSALRRRQRLQRRVERLVIHRAQHLGDISVCADEHEGRLTRDAEMGEHCPVFVVDLRKGQRMAVDELLEGALVAGPGDAVDVDLSGPLLACRFDRRGFTIAGDSSRRPEPEGDRLADDRDAVELTATDERSSESERHRDGCVRWDAGC